MLSPLRDDEPRSGGEEFGRNVDRTLDRIHDSIMASDALEFATEVLFVRFFGPVLDLVAYVVGLESQSPSTSDDGLPTEPTVLHDA